MRLEAAGGLALRSEAGALHVEWGETDWWGPIAPGLQAGGPDLERLPFAPDRAVEGEDALGAWQRWRVEHDLRGAKLRFEVRAYRDRPLLVFRIEAPDGLAALATGELARPGVVWPWMHAHARAEGGLPEGTVAYGHAYTEFALPVFSDPSLAGFLILPEPPRPAIVQPMALVAPDGRALWLLPLDAFHEQVMAVPHGRARAEDGLRCGWHGDLDHVPAGFSSELAMLASPDARSGLQWWGEWLQQRAGTRRPGRYADAAVGRLSYWTDNGAAYWYRTERGKDVVTTLREVTESLEAADVPIHAVEIDSWFYPHEHTRPVNPDGQQIVPPSGMLRWEPREDILPHGMASLREAVGGRPLILHSRHFSHRSTYRERYAMWVDGDRAHPRGADLYERLIAQAQAWGAIQYEQDWMVETYLGVRDLRAVPGRARAWQEGLDRAAGEHGLSLVWCMSTPADFCQTVHLRNVVAIRTSGDYSYLIPSGALWAWHLYGNALARALGLWPFKDVFMSGEAERGMNGDPHAELEAALSAFSAGPVGLGDRIGRTRRDLVMRTCRADGVLVKPDVPMAAISSCFGAHPHLRPVPLVGECFVDHPAGRFGHVLAIHAYRGDEHLDVDVPPHALGESSPSGEAVCWDLRRRAVHALEADGHLRARLAPGEWLALVQCPVLADGFAVIGDPRLFVPAGDRRLRGLRSHGDRVHFDVLGAPGERVEIVGIGPRAPRIAHGEGSVAFDSGSSLWRLACAVGRDGVSEFSLAP